MRDIAVDFISTGRSNEYGYKVLALDGEPLKPPEILDVLADALLYEHIEQGIDYWSHARELEVEILNTSTPAEFALIISSLDGYVLGPQELYDGVVDAVLNHFGSISLDSSRLAC